MRGHAQRTVARCIGAAEVPLSARELAQSIYGHAWREADTGNVVRTVKRLVGHGLVEEAGRSPLGARTWRLTAAGRQALDRLAAV